MDDYLAHILISLSLHFKQEKLNEEIKVQIGSIFREERQ